MKYDYLILDGRNLLWRTADVFKTLSVVINGEEIGTGGIYGFLLIAMKIHRRYGGETVVAWEGSGNFRYRLYPDYKRKSEEHAQERAEITTDLNEQERRLRAVLRSMGVRQFMGDGCEADDVIGRLAKMAASRSILIYSGDSDIRQLVRDGVTVASPGKKGGDVVYGSREVEEKHGVRPELLPDLKALAGDGSDNIPGVAGIGVKTAAKLINVYGPVEKVIEAAKAIRAAGESGKNEEKLWPVSLRFVESIAYSEQNINLFKNLATIRTDCGMVEIEPRRNQKVFLNHIMGYRFQSLVYPVELNALMGMGDGKRQIQEDE